MIVNISFTCDFFQVRVGVKSLLNPVQRNVLQKTGLCAELITKHTKTAAFLPLPSVHCPTKKEALFACNIMDRVVRLRRQNLAPGGRTAKSWTNPCVGRTGKPIRTYAVCGSPCVTPGETNISQLSYDTETSARNERMETKERKEGTETKGKRAKRRGSAVREKRTGGIRVFL